ncbi:MAG: CaiB/BaiF CoA transferase family protein [Candidatus Binatia bacterium]
MAYKSGVMPRPLEGIRVLDFSHVLSGPFCTRILCDLGAEVVKIEAPHGDLSRRLGRRRSGMSGYYMQHNCGKLNVSIDLKTEGGVDLALRLSRVCDVLVENFRPGVMDRLGLGHESLIRANPGLVYCSISGFGHASSLRDRPAYAGIAHATSGIIHRQAAFSGQPPADSVLAIGDTVTGLHAVIAIQAALALRERTGRGQFIDLAMSDALLSIQEVANFHLFGDGGSDTDVLCAWIYHCGTEQVLIPSDPRAYWEDYCRVMASPQLLRDPRYRDYRSRQDRLEELEAHIQRWVASHSSADDVVAKLVAQDFPGARVLSMAEALDSAQTAERGMTPEVEDRSGGRCRILNSPYRFSGAEAGVRGRPAFRGEHNRDLLERWLALSAEQCLELEQSGVLSSRVPSDAKV